LLFYGGKWSQKTLLLLNPLQTFIKQMKEDDDKLIDVLYISNDENERDFA
jgi:hypothetical protein